MSDESEALGATMWRRAKQLIISNPNVGEKYVLFIEEDIVSLTNGAIIAQDCGTIKSTYDPNKMINLRDLETKQPTGFVISQAMVYQALASIYMDLVDARNGVNISAPAITTVIPPNPPDASS